MASSEPLPDRWITRPIEKEIYFEKEEHFAFSPLNAELLSFENLALLLLIVKLSKTPEGIKTLKELAIKYLDSCARIVESVEDACHSNWLTALNNQHIAASIAHRIGLIDDGSYMKIMEHYRSVFDKMWEKSFIENTVGSITTLVQGSKTAGAETGATGLGALAAILKGLGT